MMIGSLHAETGLNEKRAKADISTQLGPYQFGGSCCQC